MITLTDDTQKKLVQLFDQLIDEAGNEKVLLRGHKISKDNGLSWLKTDRLTVLNHARALLISAPAAAEDQPSRRTRIRSKADVEQE